MKKSPELGDRHAKMLDETVRRVVASMPDKIVDVAASWPKRSRTERLPCSICSKSVVITPRDPQNLLSAQTSSIGSGSKTR